MQRFTSFLSIVVLLIAVSCAKMPIYESKEVADKDQAPHVETDLIDKQSLIGYGVANNESNIYFRAVFYHQQSLMKILRGGGLNLYFDPAGKKKKTYALKIERTPGQTMSPEMINSQFGSTRESRMQNMPGIIEITMTKVSWQTPDTDFEFNRKLTEDPIKIELGPNEQNELELFIQMPVAELDFLSEGQNAFSMGIESNTIKTSSNGRPNGAMRPAGGGGGGRPGGGQRSGGGMPQGRGGSRSGVPGGGGSSSAPSPIKIWFEVML